VQLALFTTGSDKTFQTTLPAAGDYYIGIGSGDFYDSNQYNLTVIVSNAAPTSANGSASVAEDTVLSANLPASSDADRDTITYAQASAPSSGSVSIAANGAYTYTPNANFNGTDTFTFTVSDGKRGSNTYTQTITVTAVNDAPVAANGSASTAEDTQLSASVPLAADVDSASLTYSLVSAATNGTVVLKANGSYTYTPKANFSGSDSFSYLASDGQANSNTATVSLSITPADDAPTLAPPVTLTYRDTAESDIYVLEAGGALIASDVDSPSSSVTFDLAGARPTGSDSQFVDARFGSLLLSRTTGSYTFFPDGAAIQALREGQTEEQFLFTASDGQASSQAVLLIIRVTGANDIPVLATPLADQAAVSASAFSFTVAANSFADVDGDSLSYTATRGDGSALPSWLNFNPNTRTFSGTPSSSDVGSLEVRVRASDGEYSTSDTFVLAIADGQPKPVPGDSGNNALRSTSANESFDGGAGVDATKFQGSASQYRFTQESGKLRVSDTTAGRDGSDTLLNIERVEFADMTLNLTVDDTARTIPAQTLNRIADLYVAFFNRVPDGDGMEYWIGQYRQGKTINDIAESFYGAGVAFSELTGYRSDMSNDDFINIVYRNVLGRPEGADEDGLKYWRAELTSGKASKGKLVSDILDAAYGPAFSDPTNPFHWVQKLLYNKLEVAKQVALAWGVNYNSPQDSISKGMAIAAAVTPDSTTAAITLVGVDLAAVDL
jgi:VCBS repeat-containing protein